MTGPLTSRASRAFDHLAYAAAERIGRGRVVHVVQQGRDFRPERWLVHEPTGERVRLPEADETPYMHAPLEARTVLRGEAVAAVERLVVLVRTHRVRRQRRRFRYAARAARGSL